VLLRRAVQSTSGARVFAYPVNDPWRHGIVEVDGSGKAIGLEEKPQNPRSRLAVIGMYFFDNRVIEIASRLKPSARGELEIIDVQRQYLEWRELEVIRLGRGFAWLDTGTHESHLEASLFVETIERRQGLKIACPEEIAFRMGYIDAAQMRVLATRLEKSSYGQYLQRVLTEPAY